jgi:hypothetical protein
LHYLSAAPGAPDGAGSGVGPLQAMTRITEITVTGGERYRVEGEAKDVERMILDAARGSIMELTWLVEAETGEQLGINPECVVMLRAISPSATTR